MSARLVFRNTQSPGDILVLSAAIRDLHIAHPGRYATDVWVSTGAEQIFWHNSDITTIHTPRPPSGLQQFVAHYPLVQHSNQQRKHFLWGFIEHINEKLQTHVKLTDFRPKLVMSAEEVAQRPFPEPYWVFLSGGKRDFPAKIWDQTWWQRIISETKDKINWVQCGGGSANHIQHASKDGIFANLIGRTTCRELIKLIYHSEGVVCGVTFAMHIAAALNKPCVVIAGGREPWWWEAYTLENRRENMRVSNPHWAPPSDDSYVPHRYLHTVGQLDCCANFGCWKAKVTGAGSVCKHPVNQNGNTIPKCLSLIKPNQVIEAVCSYKGLVVPNRLVATVPVIEITPAVSRVYCVRGGDQWINTLALDPQHTRHVTERATDMRAAMAMGDWIVWLEEGSVPAPGWQDKLQRLRQPGIYGRVHRSATNTYYPYPGGFIVHKSLLVDQPGFLQMFAQIEPKQYQPIDQFIRLSTRPLEVA